MNENVIRLFANHDVEEILTTLQNKHREKGVRSITLTYMLEGTPQECYSETHIGIAQDTTLMLGALEYNKDVVLNELKKHVG